MFGLVDLFFACSVFCVLVFLVVLLCGGEEEGGWVLVLGCFFFN